MDGASGAAGDVCRWCGYSLAGLAELKCPECGKMSWPSLGAPPLEPLEARPHVVCSINAVLCLLATVLGILVAGSRGHWGWGIGGVAGGIANFVLLGLLMVLFPSRASRGGVSVAALLCVASVVLGMIAISVPGILG